MLTPSLQRRRSCSIRPGHSSPPSGYRRWGSFFYVTPYIALEPVLLVPCLIRVAEIGWQTRSRHRLLTFLVPVKPTSRCPTASGSFGFSPRLNSTCSVLLPRLQRRRSCCIRPGHSSPPSEHARFSNRRQRLAQHLVPSFIGDMVLGLRVRVVWIFVVPGQAWERAPELRARAEDKQAFLLVA